MITFKEYYKKINVVNISIDFEAREIEMKDINNEKARILYFSKSITKQFNLVDIFESNKNEGDDIFMVFENGHENKDWLFIGQQGFTI